jgi:hypothetical protein
MRRLLLYGLLLAASAFCVSAQAPGQNSTDNNTQPTTTNTQPTATPQNTDYVRPTGKTRFKWYVNSMFGPMALGKDVVSAGWATWRNSPEEWGPHWEGFGKRFASSLGKGIIKNSMQFGLDEAFTLDSHFYRSKDRSFGAKFSNALVSTVTARKKNGNRTLGFPRILGTYSASVIGAETWYPSRYTWKDGLKNGTISLGFTAAFNLFKEFWKK